MLIFYLKKYWIIISISIIILLGVVLITAFSNGGENPDDNILRNNNQYIPKVKNTLTSIPEVAKQDCIRRGGEIVIVTEEEIDYERCILK